MPPPLSSPLILEEATPGVVGIEHGEAPGTVEEEGTWSVESVNATMAIDAAEIVLETGAPSPEAPLASAEVSAEPEAPEATPVSIKIDEAETNLHVDLYKSFASSPPLSSFHSLILTETKWRRVKYKSLRYGNDCTTPCYSEFYGGVSDKVPLPYTPVPEYLQPLVTHVSKVCGTPFNAVLLRLYFDGEDNIAWHTDGRKFLGNTPTIASLSFGGKAAFVMRRMANVWPCGDVPDGGVDKSTPERIFVCESGDMLVMRGSTQDHWHHRVPKVKSRLPRINLNFRYILPDTGEVATDGQKTYYKYMVYGDEDAAWRDGTLPGWSYEQLLRKHGSLLGQVEGEGEKKGETRDFFKTSKVEKKEKTTTKSGVRDFFKNTNKAAEKVVQKAVKRDIVSLLLSKTSPPAPVAKKGKAIPVSDAEVARLVEMGFDPGDAGDALRANEGDAEAALNSLLP